MKTLIYTSSTEGAMPVELIFFDLFQKQYQNLESFIENDPEIVEYQTLKNNTTSQIIEFKTDEAWERFVNFQDNLINIVKDLFQNPNVIDFMKSATVNYQLYLVQSKEMLASSQ